MEERERLQPLSDSQRESLEEATATYEGAITRAAAAPVVNVLKARGIDKDTAVTFRLGVVVDPFPGHAKYTGWIAIPYLGKNNQPLSIRFRCHGTHGGKCKDFDHPKYMGLPGEPTRPFNVRAIDQAEDTIHITEGEFDAMILNKIGLPAIAIPGVQNWKSHYRNLLAGFSRVFVWGDPDEPGAEFNRHVTQKLRQARAVRLRQGDVTDTYLAGGKAALLDLIGDKK